MLLIVNPKAGKGTIKKKLPKIIKNFEKKGYEAKTVYTKVDYKPSDILKDNTFVKRFKLIHKINKQHNFIFGENEQIHMEKILKKIETK